MAMIDVVNLSFSYEGSFEEVFKDVSFRIDTDWKLGFVGRNGRGKTTFLNLLLGKYNYQGRISSSTEFAYFPYEVKDKERMTLEILEEINAQYEEWQLFRELNLLNVDAEVLYRPFHTLSYGEQEKVLLASLFLGEERFLLIDEPTNHLDVEARKQIAQYLNKKKGFILVSHDRNFLDSCVDHILSINKMNIEVQKGNFSSWYANKEARDQLEAAQNQKLESEVKRLKQAARQSSGWSDQVEKSKKGQRVAGLRPDRGYIGHKAAKMMKRAKVLENRQQQAIEEKSKLLKNIDTMDSLKLCPLVYHTELLAELKDVSVYYDEKKVCSQISFNIRQGERVCLSGKNGCGKSSILKLLLGEGISYEGNVHVGSGLKISYISQDTSYLGGNLKELAQEYGLEESLFKTLLRKLDLEREQFEKDVRFFSAGQKKKVLLAKSLCEQAHLYVWDEPLNYIDVLSRVQTEELLLKYQPTIIFVEHDTAFQENVATKVIKM
ncbi:MAG: ABC-F type ribosomal protection protein [Lachnospiraceae bacterium]|nr:ABC-F type ribosomal protection protein [Lachnospiraceae bacterium]